jgi:hypothetical protein
MAVLMEAPMRRILWMLFFLMPLVVQRAEAATGPAAALDRYFAALRANDRTALQAAIAPDYRYDGVDAAQASDVFDGPLSIRYRALHVRVEALTRVGDGATATVAAIFQGNVNLGFVEGGQPLINGTSQSVVELAPRDGEWRVTASRIVRAAYTAPGRVAPHLFDMTVNERTFLQVAPGTELRIAGKVFSASRLLVTIGAQSGGGRLDPNYVTLWRLPLSAPEAPGRYLVHVIAYSDDLQVMDHVTLPVTVVAR